jgi:hypothetical protein
MWPFTSERMAEVYVQLVDGSSQVIKVKVKVNIWNQIIGYYDDRGYHEENPPVGARTYPMKLL